ncbi:MAG: glycosyltransferase family 2 protein [Eubacteriales bacterium]
MKFSIIIPVYNSAEFLHKCLLSILNQKYKDYELILVDDGSTDNSYDICSEYAGKFDNIRLLRQKNNGPSVARNNGIQAASGDYITFVDSDDWVMPSYFPCLEEAVLQSPDLVFFGRFYLRGSNQVDTAFPEGKLTSRSQIIDFLTRNYYQGDLHSCTNKVFSRRLFADGELRFPESTVVEEDLQFVLLALDRSETLVSLPESLYYYNRRGSGSVTTRYNPVKFECKLRALTAELWFAEKWHSTEFEKIFDDNYLTYISASINNLMYRECCLSRKQKIEEIRRFYNAEQTNDCIKRTKGISLRSKAMYFLIRCKLYRISYLLHYIVFHIRRR